ncbi:MAG: aconitase X catalytic domain-containing protein [Candidatus Micrarchaeia archaeon]|jgi:hypothetical protein
MELAKEEQAMLDGEKGEGAAKAMEILVAVGKIYNAAKMVPVGSVQVAGVSYKTIGDAGIEFLQGYAKLGAKCSVPSYLNPAGMDLQAWKEMGVPADFAKKQIEIVALYEKLGVKSTCTCAPYQIGVVPKLGEHLAWSESSAVCYANSVLGARTNRESGMSALAAAICGVTPCFGLHLQENRKAKVVFEVECELGSRYDYAVLGAHAGKIAGERNAAFVPDGGAKKPSKDMLKLLGAAMAATGAVALYNFKGVTPEFEVAEGAEGVTIGRKELDETAAKMNTGEEPELIAIGCPHCSLDEVKEIAEKMKSRKGKAKVWVCTSRGVKEKADAAGYTKAIEEAGGRVVCDTCMVVCPIEKMGFGTTGVDSGKAASYLPGFCKQKVVFRKLEDML